MKIWSNLLHRLSAWPEPAGPAPGGFSADAIAHVTNGKPRSSSLLGAALTPLSIRIAPLVKAELVAALVAELERHFNERLLSELQDRVEVIIARELPQRVEAIVARELLERAEAGSADEA